MSALIPFAQTVESAPITLLRPGSERAVLERRLEQLRQERRDLRDAERTIRANLERNLSQIQRIEDQLDPQPEPRLFLMPLSGFHGGSVA